MPTHFDVHHNDYKQIQFQKQLFWAQGLKTKITVKRINNIAVNNMRLISEKLNYRYLIKIGILMSKNC